MDKEYNKESVTTFNKLQFAKKLLGKDYDEYESYLENFTANLPMTLGYILSKLHHLHNEFKITANKPVFTHINQLIHNFFKSIIFIYSTNQNKNWSNQNWVELTATSFDALEMTLKIVQNNKPQALLPGEDLEAINEYVIEYANNPTMLGLIQIYTEQLLLDSFHHDESYKKGQTATKSNQFYEALAATLYDNASETTGDTEKQLQLINDCILWLIEQKIIPKDFRYMDAGCGNGMRVLKPTLQNLKNQDISPELVLAADLNPPEKNEFWQPLELDFANENFADHILKSDLDNNKLHLISLIWSPINDVHIREQLSAIRNFVQLLENKGVLILEVPAGYQEEALLHFKNEYPTDKPQPFGTIEVAFTGSAGQTIAKNFMINPIKDYIQFQQLTGLRLLNLDADFPQNIETKYITKSGKKRAFLVFQKVAEQKQSLAEIMDKKN